MSGFCEPGWRIKSGAGRPRNGVPHRKGTDRALPAIGNIAHACTRCGACQQGRVSAIANGLIGSNGTRCYIVNRYGNAGAGRGAAAGRVPAYIIGGG